MRNRGAAPRYIQAAGSEGRSEIPDDGGFPVYAGGRQRTVLYFAGRAH